MTQSAPIPETPPTDDELRHSRDMAALKHARSRINACKVAFPSGEASKAAMIREIETALDVADGLAKHFATPAQPAPAEGSREAFEAWCESEHLRTDKEADGAYTYASTRLAWAGAAWQAAQGERAGLTDADKITAAKLIEQFRGWGSSLFDDQQMRGLPSQMKQDCRCAADLLERLTGARP